MIDAVDLGALLRRSAQRLAAAGVETPTNDAGVLAAEVLGIEPVDLIRHETCTPHQAAALEGLIERREHRVPLQHLTGRAHFRRLSLLVGPGVFVPRPETELLVDAVLAELTALPHRRAREESGSTPLVVDLCTGSGAIAASIATEAPGTQVAAVELSPEAYLWAERNLEGLGVDLRLADATGCCHDLDGLVDVVVANPPYIPPDGIIRDPEVAEHDPPVALWGGGPDGLDVVRGIVARAGGLLRPGGLLVVEHADLQGVAAVAVVTGSERFESVVDHPDLTGRARFVTARRRGGTAG